MESNIISLSNNLQKLSYEDVVRKLGNLKAQVHDLKIDNFQQLKEALDLKDIIKNLHKQIEILRKEKKEPSLKVIKQIDGQARHLKKMLDDIKHIVEVKSEPLLVGNNLETEQLKTVTKWEIEDFSKLPKPLFEEREKYIRDAIAPYVNKMAKAAIELPGIKYYKEKVFK